MIIFHPLKFIINFKDKSFRIKIKLAYIKQKLYINHNVQNCTFYTKTCNKMKMMN